MLKQTKIRLKIIIYNKEEYKLEIFLYDLILTIYY